MSLVAAAAILATAPLAWAGSAAAEEPYYLGVSLPIEGDLEEPSRKMLRGVELYVDRINAEGGVDGHPIRLVVEDDGNTPEGAARVANKLADDERVLGVVGHFYSSTAMGATDVYDEQGLVNVVPVANDPRVTRGSEWVFGMLPPTHEEGRFMAIYLARVLEAERVAVIAETGAYGAGLGEAFREQAERIGLDVVTVSSFDPGEDLPDGFVGTTVRSLRRPTAPRELDAGASDASQASASDASAARAPDAGPVGASADGGVAAPFDAPAPDLDDALDADAQAVLVLSQASIGKEILERLRDAGLEAPIMVPSAFVEDPTLPDFNRSVGGRLLAVAPFLYQTANQQATRFEREYRERHGEAPGTGAPMAHDAARLIVNAIREAGPDRRKIRDYLASMQGTRALRSVTGELEMDEGGAIARPLYVTRVDEGYFKVAFTQLLPADDPTAADGGRIVVEGDRAYHRVDVAYVGIDQFRIETIDPKNFRFDSELFLWLKWKASELDTSQIVIINGIHGIDDEKYVLDEDLSGDIDYRVYRVKSTFLTPFDLRHFPFDRQTLPLEVAHKTKDSTQLMIVPDVGHMRGEPVKTYDPEWEYTGQHVYSELYRYPTDFGDPAFGAAERDRGPRLFSSVKAEVSVERKALPHVLTVLVPLIMILLLTVSVVWLSSVEFSLRLSVGMTSLLAILVFHMTQSEKLPNVGYMTKIDTYFILAYVWVFVLFLELIAVYVLQHRGREKAALRLNYGGAALVLLGMAASFGWVTWGMQ